MSTEFDKSGQGSSKQLTSEMDRSCQGTSRQVPENLLDANHHQEEFFDLNNPLNIENLRQRNKQLARDKSSAESRIKIMEEVIAAKSKAQMARAEELMARIRAIELVQVQEHVNKQLLHLNQLIDSKAKTETAVEESLTPCSIGRSVYETDYDNSLIDCIEQEMQEEGNEDHPLKSASVLSYARFLYHKRERRSVKSVSHVLGEIIKNTLPDNTETDSDSDDETGEEDILYRTVPKDKIRQYRPINSTPIAKWAKYRSHTISSWSWLNHAMTEIDFRYKKQDALYNHMRKAKPTFKLESPQPSSSSPSMSIQLKDVQGVTMFSNPGETPAFQLRFQNGADVTDMGRTKERVKQSENVRTHAKGSDISHTLYEGAGSSGSLNLLADVSELSESVQRENIEKVINTIQHNRSADQVNQVIQLSSKDGEVDVTQVASRCRPLKLCKPRKIFKMDSINLFMSDKFNAVPTDGCACEIGTACVFCLGNKSSFDVQHKSFRDEIEFLDPGFHKSLSTPDDMPVEVVLHKALQELEICEDEDERDILKPFVSVGLEDLRPQRAPSERESFTTNEHQIKKRGRGRPPNRPQSSPCPQSNNSNYSPDITWPPGYQNVPVGQPKKKKSKVADRKRPTKRKDTRKSDKKKDDTEESEYEDDSADIVQSSSSFKAAYKKLRAGRRRSDFDINNIVIPSHYSANTRVEKLLYKEIIIPSFREINFEPQLSDESLKRPKKAGIKRVKRFLQKIDDDYEDLDDELIKARHDRCEEEERRKFSSAIPKSSNRRRRNAKSESNDAGGKISESVEVHEVSPPNTPLTSHSYFNDEGHLQVISSEEASLAASALKVSQGRRRTISVSKKEEEEAKECAIAPFSPRNFPLPKDLYEEMKKDMPDDFFCGSP